MKWLDFRRKTQNVKLLPGETKTIMSKCIREKFDRDKNNQETAQKLILTAHMWNLPCLDEMLSDYEFEDFPLC